MDRRSFLRVAGGAIVSEAVVKPTHAAAQVNAIPIIDTHIHLFDPNRPQGAPYSGSPNSPVSKTGAFPDGYKKLVGPLGVVGAIEIEASPWIEDNLWVLEVCADRDLMVGTVGNLKPEDPNFPEYLERYHKNRLFRGIRYGNLWGYDIASQSKSSAFLGGLKLLAQADLALDTANPRIDLLESVVRINDAIPDLRVVIDHLPSLEPTAETAAAYDSVLKEIHERPNIYCKLSAVIHLVDGQVSTNLADHTSRLDRLVEVFGDDRVLFGSDWPNSDFTTTVDQVIGIMREYYASKPREAAEKYFWQNSCRVYKWIPRASNQPRLN